MTFYYCGHCKEFYTGDGVSESVDSYQFLCLKCYCIDVTEYRNKTFSDMVAIERLFKIKQLRNK